MTESVGAGARRSPTKRRAMLDAAEQLFVRQGYERTSVDAIAERAGVSKRTVYDHFGDKSAVFRAALDEAGTKLGSVLASAIEEELPPDRDVRDGLLAFARRVTKDAFQSSAYLRYLRLASVARGLSTDDPSRPLEDAFARRIARYVQDGALEAANPARAAQHFVALTLWMSREAAEDGMLDKSALDATLVDGVDAFLRAYPPIRASR